MLLPNAYLAGDMIFFPLIQRLEFKHANRAQTFPMDKWRVISCQIETEPAQRTRGHNQARGAEKNRNKEAPVVKKGLKGEGAAVRAPEAAEERVAARGPTKKILRINKQH